MSFDKSELPDGAVTTEITLPDGKSYLAVSFNDGCRTDTLYVYDIERVMRMMKRRAPSSIATLYEQGGKCHLITEACQKKHLEDLASRFQTDDCVCCTTGAHHNVQDASFAICSPRTVDSVFESHE